MGTDWLVAWLRRLTDCRSDLTEITDLATTKEADPVDESSTPSSIGSFASTVTNAVVIAFDNRTRIEFHALGGGNLEVILRGEWCTHIVRLDDETWARIVATVGQPATLSVGEGVPS